MPKREDVVAEARRWIGTPYQHQARLRGVGVDCIQLVMGVGIALGIAQPLEQAWMRYARTPNPKLLLAGMAEKFDRVPPGDEQDGDIAVMAWRKKLPMHTGILASCGGRRSLIHAYSTIGQVVEHSLTDDWRARIESVWSFRGLTQ